METIKKTFPAIDVAKLAMAVLVVIIHKPLFLQPFPNYMLGSVLGDAAVPFFFTASAFLFFRKLDREPARPCTRFCIFASRCLWRSRKPQSSSCCKRRNALIF